MICSLAEKCICQGKLIELLQGVDWDEVVQTAGSAVTAVREGHPEKKKIYDTIIYYIISRQFNVYMNQMDWTINSLIIVIIILY